MIYDISEELKKRLLWVRCACGKRHLICLKCAAEVGSFEEKGKRLVGKCAKGYFKRARRKAREAEKGATA